MKDKKTIAIKVKEEDLPWDCNPKKKFAAFIALRSKVKSEARLVKLVKSKKPLPKYIGSYAFEITNINPTEEMVQTIAFGFFFKNGWTSKNKVWFICPQHEISNESR